MAVHVHAKHQVGQSSLLASRRPVGGAMLEFTRHDWETYGSRHASAVAAKLAIMKLRADAIRP